MRRHWSRSTVTTTRPAAGAASSARCCAGTTTLPLSSIVTFVAPRNMPRNGTYPLPPTIAHRPPYWNRQLLMSTASTDFFVYVTKTYARSSKWEKHHKNPLDSVTWVEKLESEGADR